MPAVALSRLLVSLSRQALIAVSLIGLATCTGDGNQLGWSVAEPVASAPLAVIDSAASVFGIGSVRGREQDELSFRNGLISGMIDTNGSIVVVDGAKVLRFGRDGSVLHRWERIGSGPDEARQISSICRARGDTLVAFDVSLRRLSYFDTELSLLEQESAAEQGMLGSFGCFGDGTLLLQRPSSAVDGGIQATLIRLDPGSKIRDSIESVELLSSTSRTFVVVRKGVVWVADPREATIRRLDASGRALRGIRLSEPDIVLSPAEAERRRIFATARGSSARGSGTATPSDRRAPRYDAAVPADDGLIWLQLAARDDTRVRTFVAIDTSGSAAMRIEVAWTDDLAPPTLLDASREELLLLRRHPELGASLEVLRIRSLSPSPRSP